jgi:hypothetical protein
LTAKVEEMLEAGGRDECRSGPAALEKGVGGDGRPVGEPVDSFGSDCLCGGEDGLLLTLAGDDLGRPHLSFGDEDGVREGAADVDPERAHGWILASERRCVVLEPRTARRASLDLVALSHKVEPHATARARTPAFCTGETLDVGRGWKRFPDDERKRGMCA